MIAHPGAVSKEQTRPAVSTLIRLRIGLRRAVMVIVPVVPVVVGVLTVAVMGPVAMGRPALAAGEQTREEAGQGGGKEKAAARRLSLSEYLEELVYRDSLHNESG